VGTANDSGNTALHWACLMGQEEVVRLLMEAGASAFALNKMYNTPVDEALSRGHQHIVDVINSFSAPSKEVDEADDVPDDAEEAGEDADMELEGSRSIAEQQHTDAPSQ
jgi:ankyrin repeat protein